MLAVYFDTSVLRLGIRRSFVAEPQTINWGGRTISVNVSRIAERDVPTSALRKEVAAIKVLVQLIQHGTIVPFTSLGGTVDGMGLRRMGLMRSELSLFEGVRFSHAVEPDFFGQTKFAVGGNFQPKQVWTKFLSTKIYSRFSALKKALGDNKDADAFLIWTAEFNDIGYFVTVDQKLINTVRNQRSCPFKTHVTLPSELRALLTGSTHEV